MTGDNVAGDNTAASHRLQALAARARKSIAFRSRRLLSSAKTRQHARRRRHLPRVLVLGDSHARVFRDPSFESLPVRFDTESIMGATIAGLENPNSQTQAGPIFDRRLREAGTGADRPAAIIVMLGEVDCGFVIWWMHENDGLALDTGLSRTVDRLTEFTKRALAIAPTIVVSAQLPTIRDNADFPEYAGLRREIKASQRDRTELVLELNRRAQIETERAGATYLALDEPSLGPDGLVSPTLVKPYATDHHYDGPVYAQLLQLMLGSLPPFSG